MVSADVAASAARAASITPSLALSHAPTISGTAMSGTLGMLSSGSRGTLSGGPMAGANPPLPSGAETDVGSAALSFTPGAYRFVDGSGYLGRVGEYDTLDDSAEANLFTAYVSPHNHLTVVSRANVVSGSDYSAGTQLTASDWVQAGLFIRSFIQQQGNYPFYAFPVLDVPPGSSSSPDSTTNLIPGQSVFGITRRLGKAYGKFKVPNTPVRLFVRGDWTARSGVSQLAYLHENTLPITPATPCGAQCHFNSQFQPVNYTTRNVSGGAQVDLKQLQVTWEHTYSSFNDRLQFPVGTFTGPFTPEAEGISVVNPPVPPATCPTCNPGPAPMDAAAGNYFINPPSPDQASTDRVSLSWTGSPNLSFNGNVGYTRLTNTYTNYPQNTLVTDETLNWRATERLRVTADYHQQNLINNFTPYYTLFGNVSYHQHEAGARVDYELLQGLAVEPYYQHSGISRANAFLWPQEYSMDNSDLLTVVPSSSSNTGGLALRYHDGGWNARAGYEFTGTNNPGYLIVPQSNNRAFASLWVTPNKYLVLSNDFSVIAQNAFPAIPLLRSDGTGDTGDFQRRNRFYFETFTATVRPSADWNVGLGYSYQQNNLTTYMAFQNDSSVGYVVNEPAVPIRQITQAYWAESAYNWPRGFGVNFRLTYNSSRSGMRPNVNPSDAAQLGNASLISQGAFDPNALFPSALSNVQFSATQISEVIVPQWIGQGKAYYVFPHKIEGGAVFYYGGYRDYWNPNLNGVLRTATIYVGRTW